MSAADAACYVAKDSGRNRVHEYELDDTLVAERYGEMQWIHRIHRAFEDRRFRLFYQLIQPLAESQPSRELLCEVFIRMLDKTGKVIEPSAFIAAAERYHLIGSLDRWVVKTAFSALAEAQRREWSRPVLFAINLSGQSIGEESFLSFVVEELERSGVDSRRICFEITETAAISKLDSAIRFISVLKTKGCRFILDDFGSGLSSFAYLRDLQVDFLKIDGEFVQNMMEDRVKRAMVESINQIGHVMGLQTIARMGGEPPDPGGPEGARRGLRPGLLAVPAAAAGARHLRPFSPQAGQLFFEGQTRGLFSARFLHSFLGFQEALSGRGVHQPQPDILKPKDQSRSSADQGSVWSRLDRPIAAIDEAETLEPRVQVLPVRIVEEVLLDS